MGVLPPGRKSVITWFDSRGRELHKQEYRYELYSSQSVAISKMRDLIKISYPNCGYATLTQQGGPNPMTIRVQNNL